MKYLDQKSINSANYCNKNYCIPLHALLHACKCMTNDLQYQLNLDTFQTQRLMVIGTKLHNGTAASSRVPQKLPKTVVAFGRGHTGVGLQKNTANTAVAPKPARPVGMQAGTSSSSTLMGRRSGSMGHLSMATITQPSPANHRCTCPANGHQIVCKCANNGTGAEPGGMAFLEGVYVQNLQTQIEVLELENAYLRGATERGALFAKKQPPPSVPVELPRRYAKILTHASQTQRRRHSATTMTEEAESEAEEEEEAEWTRSRKTAQKFAIGQQRQNASTSTTASKRVGFSVDEPLRFSDASDEQPESGSGGRRRWASTSAETQQIARLQAERDDLQRALNAAEDAADISSRERRTLHAANADLQRRLDELTPLLAEREARMLRQEQELHETQTRLKTATKRLHAAETQLEERTRDTHKQDADRERSVQRLQRQLDDAEAALDAQRTREDALQSELERVRARLAEEEEARQRALEERDADARVANARAERAERERAQLDAQLQEARQARELLDAELALARERVQHETDAQRALQAKLEEHERSGTSARARVQRELEALQGMSHSLANENQGLREERAALAERVDELRKRLHGKDGRVQRLADLLAEFLEKYRQSMQRAKSYAGRQTEELEQFEQIVHKIRQLQASPTAGSSPSSSAGTGIAGILPPDITTSLSTSSAASTTRHHSRISHRSKMD